MLWHDEVIVVDNASWERESLRQLKGEFPETTLIENAENLGFARGSNAGLEVSRGRHLLLLNPDTSVGEGALDTEHLSFSGGGEVVGVIPR